MDADYKFEKLEDYFGEKEEIIKNIDECHTCGAKLVFSHLPDYKNLIMQETARCMECGKIIRKLISIIN